ncbi:MAG: hypothetical protein K9J43_08750, partial [Polynucleobacter sp.]|nr:hypothetical protein [Polynucleobacter sp.]
APSTTALSACASLAPPPGAEWEMMSRVAATFQVRAASMRALTTKLEMPFCVCEGATSPDAGRRGRGAAAGFTAGFVAELLARPADGGALGAAVIGLAAAWRGAGFAGVGFAVVGFVGFLAIQLS